jgi:hypothetical protein
MTTIAEASIFELSKAQQWKGLDNHESKDIERLVMGRLCTAAPD